MSLRDETIECRAWERTLHAGSPETRKAAALPGPWELCLPFLMPLYGLMGWGAGAKFEAEWWIAVIPWWWLLSFGRLFPRTVPSEWEALQLPSRRGWLLARWSLRLPTLALLGLCTAAHHLLLALRDVPDPEGIRWSLVAALLLAPPLFAALASWFPLQERAFGGRSWIAPLFALVLVVVLLGIAATIYFVKESGPDDAPLASGSLAVVAVLVLGLTLPSLASLRRGAARYSGGSGLASMFLHGLVGICGILPATVLGIGVLFPRTLLVPRGDPHLAAASTVLLLLTAGGLVVVILDALHLVGTADIGVDPRPEVNVVRRTVPGPAAAARAGRGLRAAAWALYRGRWRNLRHPWLTFLPRLLYECRAPACGFVAVILMAIGSCTGGFRGILGAWLVPLALFIIPRPLLLPASRRLHLLGADFGAVALHNLRWGFLLEVLPAALGGAVVLLPWMTKVPLSPRVGAFLVTVAVLLLRQGPGAGPFLEIARWLGRWVSIAALAGAAAGWFLAPETTVLVVGTVLFAVAAEASVRTLRDTESAGRRIEERAVDD